MSKYWTFFRVIVGSTFLNLALFVLPKNTSTLIKMLIIEMNKNIQEKQREYYRGMN
jgi:hypothetical protein